jgi:hypothetical protein
MSDRRRRGRQPIISAREWRWFWIITLILTVIGGGGTALTVLFAKPEEPKNLLPTQSPFRTDIADTIPKTVLLSDFDLPAPGGTWLSKSWLYSRDSRPWTQQEIAPYWIPVDKVPLLSLPQQNAQKIDKLFGDVR